MATAGVLALAVVVIFTCCFADPTALAPPYYLTTLKTTYYILPVLRFNETELQPWLSEATYMEHVYGIHENYQTRMHTTLVAWRKDNPRSQLAHGPIIDVIKKLDAVPDEYRERVKVEVGGFINHCIVWGVMSPNKYDRAREPTGKILRDIERAFITVDMFRDQFTDEAMSFVGSGYVWLVRTSFDQKAPMKIVKTSEEDSPFTQGYLPLLVLDMWEHAYYQMHVWKREQYIANWWKLVDWDYVAEMEEFWRTGRLPKPDTQKQEL